MNVSLKIKNLNVQVKKSILLKDVSFTVPKGCVCAFIGHNGAGKTTTIKSILGLRSYNNGTIKINGADAKKVLSRKIIGYVPEKSNDSNIKPLVFLRNIADFKHVPKQKFHTFVTSILNDFHLPSDRLKVKMNRLSSGQNKLLTIAQAFLGRPKIVIMDEPTDNLDPDTRELFYNFIYKQKKAMPKITYFISTHNLDEIENYADYVVLIKGGEIQYFGPYTSNRSLRQTYSDFVKTGVFNPSSKETKQQKYDRLLAEDKITKLEHDKLIKSIVQKKYKVGKVFRGKFKH
jgi:ABC-2 type transport system ATP-binding protein